MSVRYAILGLLIEQPMHGYRLKKVIDHRLSPLWGLTTGQIYQSLGAMERSALVESRIERRRNRPQRKVYTVTPAGRRTLSAWLDKWPSHACRTIRDEPIVRMMFAEGQRALDLDRWMDRECDEIQVRLKRISLMRETATAKGWRELASIYLTSLQHRLEADLKNLRMFRTQIGRELLRKPSADPAG